MARRHSPACQQNPRHLLKFSLPLSPPYHYDRRINIPNYDSVRQSVGFKNVSLGNVLSARDIKERVTFLAEEDQVAYRTLVNSAFEVQVRATTSDPDAGSGPDMVLARMISRNLAHQPLTAITLA